MEHSDMPSSLSIEPSQSQSSYVPSSQMSKRNESESLDDECSDDGRMYIEELKVNQNELQAIVAYLEQLLS